MSRYACIAPDGRVLNLVLLEEDSRWRPPPGCRLVEASGPAEPGGRYESGAFVRGARPKPPAQAVPEAPSVGDRRGAPGKPPR